jgi:FkbM family methyltransferase
MAFVLHFLRPCDLFVDVGANVGSYTVLAAAGIGARCIAFEPDADAFEWLCKNIDLNGVRAVVDARHEAVSSNRETLHLTVGLGPTNHVIDPPEISSSACPGSKINATSLDEALGRCRPIMLKIDVEGFETEVVCGALNVLEAPDLRCLLIELSGYGLRYGADENRLRERIIELGFSPCHYEPFGRRLEVNVSDTPKIGGNVLFVRDVNFVKARVESAAPFTIRGWRI